MLYAVVHSVLTTLRACQSGVWARPDTPGQYAFFNASSCPAGWVAANGANGTVDLRGEFIRGWDNGRGIDSGRLVGRWQPASRVGYVNGAGVSMDGPTNAVVPAYSYPAPGISVDLLAEDVAVTASASISAYPGTSPAPGTMANVWTYASRPRNVALLSCMKL